jgi:hypothetical protein
MRLSSPSILVPCVFEVQSEAIERHCLLATVIIEASFQEWHMSDDVVHRIDIADTIHPVELVPMGLFERWVPTNHNTDRNELTLWRMMRMIAVVVFECDEQILP